MKTNENLTLFRVEAGVLCAGRRETTVGNVANLDLNSGMVRCGGDHDDEQDEDAGDNNYYDEDDDYDNQPGYQQWNGQLWW